jgi:molybdenum cofactor cytidylyltransferase
MRQPGTEGSGDRELIAGILLAAGQSTRFRRQKLLEPLDGEAMVRHAVRAFIAAGLAPVIVVVSAASGASAAVAGMPVRLIENARPELGISGSIACGLEALGEATGAAMIGVADQPRLTKDALLALIHAFAPGRIVVPLYGDHRGNPAVFDRRFFGELLELRGDRGGQLVVAAHPESVIEVPLPAALGEDIDEPGQWPG